MLEHLRQGLKYQFKIVVTKPGQLTRTECHQMTYIPTPQKYFSPIVRAAAPSPREPAGKILCHNVSMNVTPLIELIRGGTREGLHFGCVAVDLAFMQVRRSEWGNKVGTDGVRVIGSKSRGAAF